MTELVIKGTNDTPEIDFNPVSGILKMSGRAYSPSINMFYKTMDTWLDEYLHSPSETTILEMRMDYCNSIFNKLLLVFFEKIKTVVRDNRTLVIRWHVQEDDQDAMEDITRISKTIKFPIELIPYTI
jgi:hypothetical protein